MKEGKKDINPLLFEIANRCKQLRTKKGVSQEVFYDETGINIGRIERAKRNVSATTIEAICNYFDIKISDFFAGMNL